MANNLKEIRQMRGFSREALAKVSGIKARSIKAWEDEQVDLANASFKAIMKLAKALETEPEAFFVYPKW